MIKLNEQKLAEKDERIVEIRAEVRELEDYKRDAAKYRAMRDEWAKRRDAQRSNHIQRLESISQQKETQVDNLRREMLKRIRAVKMEMLSQSESELKGTTRLTVEQNTHLTAELEY